MYLICYGTRPELIKLIPLINKFKERKIDYITLFSGQHEDLIKDFYNLVDEPDIILDNVMEKGQSLNQLISKILLKIDIVLTMYEIKNVIIQGDTSTAFSIALSAFHHQKKIIHIEAGLRTHDKYSPFPEEMNRSIISKLTDIHLCPTQKSVENLNKEGIIDNVYLVGNTIVDIFSNINNSKEIPNELKDIPKKYLLVTLHRRENRGPKMIKLWDQINILANDYDIIYITHPSLPESKKVLKNIILLEPQTYISMVYLIKNCSGIITDSGGLQEEAVCAKKKILVCRDTTERPETIDSGYGKLVDINIIDNIEFLFKENKNILNPYGEHICDKIIKYLSFKNDKKNN